MRVPTLQRYRHRTSRPRPVRRTRAGTRRTNAPRGLLGADSKLATSRRRPVDAQARPRQAALPESTGIQSSSQPERPRRPRISGRMSRASSRASADAPATPPQNAAPRPVRRTRAGARRTSGPERLPGTDSKLATSRRRPVDAQARPAKLARPESTGIQCTETRTSPTPPTQSRSGGVRDSRQAVRRRSAPAPRGVAGTDASTNRDGGIPRYRAECLEAWAGRSIARAERAKKRDAHLSAAQSAGDTPEECREPPGRSKPPRSGP